MKIYRPVFTRKVILIDVVGNILFSLFVASPHLIWAWIAFGSESTFIWRFASFIPLVALGVYGSSWLMRIQWNMWVRKERWTTYVRRGEQPLVLTPGKNVKHYIAGALNCRTGRVLYSDGPSKNSDLFIALLDKLHHSYRRPQVIHLILDNYVIHKSRKTMEALEKLGPRIQLHFLPPYSPEHNAIERLWKQMHDNVTRNHRHKTMAQLLENVKVFLHDAQPFPGTKFSTQRRVA